MVVTEAKEYRHRLSRNFWLYEFKCRCCGAVMVSPRLVQLLQAGRERLGAPIKVNSGYRCAEHNAAVGSTESSQHRKGRAADIWSPERPLESVVEVFESLLEGWGGLGYYWNDGFIHVDVRGNGPARWSE